MIEKRGTTPSWMRPIYSIFEMKNNFEMVDLLDVLVETKMAQSRAEARRLLKQGRVWTMDETTSPRKLVGRNFRPLADERIIVGEPKFVDWKGGPAQVLDVTKGSIIQFILAAGV